MDAPEQGLGETASEGSSGAPAVTHMGTVVSHDDGYRFLNDGNLQRLTTATLQEAGRKEELEVDLRPFANRGLEVVGDWQFDWIMEVTSIQIAE